MQNFCQPVASKTFVGYIFENSSMLSTKYKLMIFMRIFSQAAVLHNFCKLHKERLAACAMKERGAKNFFAKTHML